ncbi:MAG: M67 family metallopeptidase [Anaerolineae bacterium]|nr:M67 family metallopeptidase [Anaerolineae bacterium]
MLRLTAQLQTKINEYGAAAFPNEGCGLLLGYQQNGANLVAALHPAPNSWPVEAEKPERFQISSDEILKAELAAMAQGLELIGIFHSHPNHPPVASPRDLAWATWPGYSYLITEIRDGQPRQSRSWQLTPDRTNFMEESVEII